MGPKSPKRCLINSCSGNEGSSDSYRTPEPTILEGRQLTETGSSLSSLERFRAKWIPVRIAIKLAQIA